MSLEIVHKTTFVVNGQEFGTLQEAELYVARNEFRRMLYAEFTELMPSGRGDVINHFINWIERRSGAKLLIDYMDAVNSVPESKRGGLEK